MRKAVFFPRATSQAAVFVWIFGGCREGQYPAASSGTVGFGSNYRIDSKGEEKWE